MVDKKRCIFCKFWCIKRATEISRPGGYWPTNPYVLKLQTHLSDMHSEPTAAEICKQHMPAWVRANAAVCSRAGVSTRVTQSVNKRFDQRAETKPLRLETASSSSQQDTKM